MIDPEWAASAPSGINHLGCRTACGSSTRTPTKRRRSPRTRCCRSSGRSPTAAGVEVELRDISLAGRILAQFPDRLDDEPARRRRARRARRAGQDARGEHHQAAQHQRVGPAAQGRDRRAAGQGLRAAGLPRRPAADAERRRPRPLRQGQGQRRQPGAARGQLRPPRARLGQGLRAQAPALDGRVVAGLEDSHVAHDERRRLPLDRAVGRSIARDGSRCASSTSAPTAPSPCSRSRSRARRRGRRRHGDAHAALASSWPRRSPAPRSEGVLFSVHLKATMMKVSDPIIFGHAVRAFFADVFAQYGDALQRPASTPTTASARCSGVERCPRPARGDHGGDRRRLRRGPGAGDGRLRPRHHQPARAERRHHRRLDAGDDPHLRPDVERRRQASRTRKFVIPDPSYAAAVRRDVIDDCRAHGAFDPATMGTTPNVGLMAQAAEEYGSHDKTFEIAAAGTVRVVDDAGRRAARARVRQRRHLAHVPDQGRPDPRLGEARGHARARDRRSGRVLARRDPRARRRADQARSDADLAEHDTDGLQIEIMDVGRRRRASRSSASRSGEDTISVTGNVLRDYLTDLFPILELGTSAKMLSIVPLMSGGGLFETGAGGSAPKHVQQFLKENHLRWDSPRRVPRARGRRSSCWPRRTGNARAQVLADTLDRATGTLLEEDKSRRARSASSTTAAATSTSRCTGPQELAEQTEDAELAAAFAPLAERLADERADRSSTSSTRCRARRSTSAATTAPTPDAWPPRCARARRSTRRWRVLAPLGR